MILGDVETTIRFSGRLFEEGVFATSVVFPTVALDRARIRTIVTAAHTDDMLDQALAAFDRVGRELGVIARVTVAGDAAADTRRGPRSSARSTLRGSPPGSGTAATCRSTRTCTRSGRRTRTRSSRRTARWPSSAGSRSSRSPTTWTSTRRCRPTGSPRSRTASATSASAAERWADRGLAVRFGVEVTYERRYEDEIRGWLRRHPHDYVIGSVHISARSPYKAGRVAGFVAGRPLAEIVAPYFDEVIGAAQSGLFDTIGHLDFVKRYLVPHVHARGPRRRARAVRARARGRSSRAGRRSRSTRRGCASCRGRRTPPPRSSRRYRELGGRHVTIGSDAHRTEWFSYGLRQAYRHATGAGFEALAFRRGGERVLVPLPASTAT